MVGLSKNLHTALEQFVLLVGSFFSRIHSCLFSDWGCTVSSKFFDTQVLSVSTEELVFPRYARCVLSRLRVNGHSLLLNSYLTRIGRIKNPSCSACPRTPLISFCIVQIQTLSVACSLATLCLSTTSEPGPGDFPGFWSSMVFSQAPIPRKGSGNNNSTSPFEPLAISLVSNA